MPPPPKHAPAFFVFGRDLDDAAGRAAAEKVTGRVPQDQYAHPVIWRGPDPIPAPKWMTEATTLTAEETEDWVATIFMHAGAEPRPRGDEEAWKDFVDLLEGLRAVVAD